MGAYVFPEKINEIISRLDESRLDRNALIAFAECHCFELFAGVRHSFIRHYVSSIYRESLLGYRTPLVFVLSCAALAMSKKSRYPEGVIVKRSFHRFGLFATRPYTKGDRVIEYVGRPISEAEAYTSRSRYLLEVSKNRTIDGKPGHNPAGYINHSCRPNCEVIIWRGHIFIKARKSIRQGEEFTYDYGKEYF